MAKITLSVSANLLEIERSGEKPKSIAYLLSAGGKLLDQQPLDAKGVATLTVPDNGVAQAVRVFVGPEIKTHDELAADLLRRGAVETRLRLEARATRATATLQILPSIWRCWLRSACIVRGMLVKRTDRDGITLDLPVTRATVEVYEVDPLTILIPKIPLDILERIRDLVLQPQPMPPDPIGPVSNLPLELETHRKAALTQASANVLSPARLRLTNVLPTIAAPPALTRALSNINIAIPRPAIVQPLPVTPIVNEVPDGLRMIARAGNETQLREALLNHPVFIRPILCRYFPQLVTMQLVATAVTDDCGHFQAQFFRGCGNPDQPDLYFKAKQRLFGFFDVTIYAPTPIACHTHWDYVCGTEVTLRTTHPLAVTANPCAPVVAPNNWVLFMAVGNHPVSRIRGASAALAASTDAGNQGLTDGNAPFGGVLRFRLEFDNDLRDTLNVKYYQMSYRKGTSGAFTPMVGECHRHYTHEVGDDLVLEVFPLGPKVVNSTANLFEIPPSVPPLGQWSFPDAVEDLTNARFNTLEVAPLATRGEPWPEHGKYQVKLDLFDATGAPVDIAAKGIRYRVPSSTDLSGTVETADAATLGLVSGNSMIVTLHVDNSQCAAVIDAPTIAGNAADDCCGVLTYGPGDVVTMPWIADHATGFATYSFGVVRGTRSVFGQSGAVGAGLFSTTQTAAALLSNNPAPGCDPGGCTVAGFAESLYVAATATNGWSRLSGYDASAVRAFVLAQPD